MNMSKKKIDWKIALYTPNKGIFGREPQLCIWTISFLYKRASITTKQMGKDFITVL